MQTEPLSPSPALLCKLGSIVVHVEEFLSPEGHDFDRQAIAALLADPEVKAWLSAMNALAMLPLKRKGPGDAG